eukprot:7659959-Alexandrium_andersonii.AAC.1
MRSAIRFKALLPLWALLNMVGAEKGQGCSAPPDPEAVSAVPRSTRTSVRSLLGLGLWSPTLRKTG